MNPRLFRSKVGKSNLSSKVVGQNEKLNMFSFALLFLGSGCSTAQETVEVVDKENEVFIKEICWSLKDEQNCDLFRKFYLQPKSSALSISYRVKGFRP